MTRTFNATPQPWKPWDEAPPAALHDLLGVMTDIDDTLTRDGRIEPEALSALHDLAAAGLPVVAITGRPLGFCVPFAQAWPVAAIVAENGAVVLVRDGERVHTVYAQDADVRAANAPRLQAAAARVLKAVPGATLAQDSPGRVTDIAIDHSEFAHLGPAAIEQAVRLLQADGLTVTVSSIHINAWIGSHDKWTGAQWMVQHLYGRDLAAERERWVYVGDSTNDQRLFEQLPLTVGVANLMRFAAQLVHWPAYLTQQERGRGFAEVAQAVLASRRLSKPVSGPPAG